MSAIRGRPWLQTLAAENQGSQLGYRHVMAVLKKSSIIGSWHLSCILYYSVLPCMPLADHFHIRCSATLEILNHYTYMIASIRACPKEQAPLRQTSSLSPLGTMSLLHTPGRNFSLPTSLHMASLELSERSILDYMNQKELQQIGPGHLSLHLQRR